MRRAAWWVVPVLVASCSNGGGSADTTLPAATTQPSVTAPPSTEASTPELPVLADLATPDWTPSTRSEELAVALDTGDPITPQQAVDIIGLVVPGMPGTTPTDLPAGDGLGDAFTLNLASRMRDRLSPAQQQVVDQYLEPGRLVGTVTPSGEVIPAGAPPDATTSTASTAVSGGWRAASAPPDVIDFDYLNLAAEVLAAWDSHLPTHPQISVELHLLQGGATDGWTPS